MRSLYLLSFFPVVPWINNKSHTDSLNTGLCPAVLYCNRESKIPVCRDEKFPLSYMRLKFYNRVPSFVFAEQRRSVVLYNIENSYLSYIQSTIRISCGQFPEPHMKNSLLPITASSVVTPAARRSLPVTVNDFPIRFHKDMQFCLSQDYAALTC
jgi:hypothetical protein